MQTLLADVDVVTREALEGLLEKESEPCLSILLPTHRKGRETKQNPIRFGNLVTEAEKDLNDRGFSPEETDRFLEPLRSLIGDSEFWIHQGAGLAVFRTEEAFERYRLPFFLPEAVSVGRHFYVKPLVPAFVGDREFYVLAVSHKAPRLLRANKHEFEVIETPDLPHSPAEIVGPGILKSIQYHTGTANITGRGGRAAIFHGQGAAGDEAQAKKDLLKYFQQIDEGIGKRIKGTEAPLVLAGVDYVRSIYRQASGYSRLLEEGVKGSHEETDPREIHQRAWEIISRLFEEELTKAEDLFKHLAGVDPGRTAIGVAQAIPAALHRRVSILFVAEGKEAWGAYHPETNTVDYHEGVEEGDEELLNLAVISVLRSGGALYPLPPERMPGNGLIAAVLHG